MQTVSPAYLLGIQEGRAVLRAHIAAGIDQREAIASEIATLRALLARGFGPDMQACFRGELDFFLNQAKGMSK